MANGNSYRQISADSIAGLKTIKNYIANSNFEQNTLGTITGWKIFNTTLTSGLPTGALTVGTANGMNTPTVYTGSPLSGRASMVFSNSTTTCAGQGLISDPFTLDEKDLAKVMSFQAAYKVANGVGADFSGILGQQTIAWYLYDVTASAWVQPSGFLGMNSTGPADNVSGNFQSAYVLGQQYRLAIMFLQNPTATGVNIRLDEISVSTQAATQGAAMSDWQAYSPSISAFGTVTGASFKSRRVGDSLEVKGVFSTGTVTGSQVQITLGYNGANANVVADTSKVPPGGVVGVGAAGATGTYAIYVLAPSSNQNYINLGIQASGTAGSNAALGSNFASSTVHEIEFSIPIVGFSSNVQQSSDSDQRTVAAYFTAAGSQTIANSTATPVSFSTVTDTHAAFSSTNNTYIIPTSGFYEIIAKVEIQAGATQSIPIQLFLNSNGSVIAGANVSDVATASKNTALGNYNNAICSTIRFLAAGTSIAVSTTQYSGGTQTINGDSYLQIKRLSGSAVVQATESMCAIYGMTSSQAVSANAVIKYDTKVKDTHNFYSTLSGLASPSIGGTFRISVVANLSSGASLYVKVSGVSKGYIVYGTASTVVSGSISVPLLAGDTVGIYLEAAATVNLAGAQGFLNQVTIERTGN